MDGNKVSQWYNDHAELEDKRLVLGRLEYEVTLHYIREAIDSVRREQGRANGLSIADIGCGTGVYALALARDGHHLSIADISSAEVDLAVQTAQATGIQFTTSSTFDARDLRQHSEIYKPSHYDIVLLLGPLYHIFSSKECGDTLLMALETVKPGGYVLAAFVTRNAHLRDLASKDPRRLEREWGFYEGYLRVGMYSIREERGRRCGMLVLRR